VVIVDTNVLVDVLGDDPDYVPSAASVLSLDCKLHQGFPGKLADRIAGQSIEQDEGAGQEYGVDVVP
jgi:hypothetical protein